jgi:hypothetical protein
MHNTIKNIESLNKTYIDILNNTNTTQCVLTNAQFNDRIIKNAFTMKWMHRPVTLCKRGCRRWHYS